MPIQWQHGDLFAVPAFVRVNPVNCVGVMGAGLAREFKKRYPAMFEDYHRRYLNNQVYPGALVVWQNPGPDGGYIVNLPTKLHWRDPAQLTYVDQGLQALHAWAVKTLGVKNTRIAVPALGCGLGGLQWSEVRPQIVYHLGNLPFTVLVFEPGG